MREEEQVFGCVCVWRCGFRAVLGSGSVERIGVGAWQGRDRGVGECCGDQREKFQDLYVCRKLWGRVCKGSLWTCVLGG